MMFLNWSLIKRHTRWQFSTVPPSYPHPPQACPHSLLHHTLPPHPQAFYPEKSFKFCHSEVLGMFVVVVQSLSLVWLSATPWTAARQASLSFTISQSLFQTHAHRVGDAIQPSHTLLSPSPPAFNLSQHHGLFQGVSSSHQVSKVLELQLQQQSFQ